MKKNKLQVDPNFIFMLVILGVWWTLSGSALTQRSEIETLQSTANPETWIQALSSPDRTVREYAIENILDNCDRSELENLLLSGIDAYPEQTQAVILRLLATMETSGSGDIAIQFLDSENVELRSAALDVIAVNPLLRCHDLALSLADDPDPGVQLKALRALAAYEDPSDLPKFIDFLNRPNAQMRDIASDGIISIAEKSDDVLPAIMGLAYGNDPVASQAAIYILGEIGDESALDNLFVFLSGGAPALTGDLAEAIGKIDGPEAENRALDLFRNGDNRDRAHAARVLGELGCEDAAAELWSAGADHVEDFWVRMYSLEALATCAPPEYSVDLIEYLNEAVLDPRLIRTIIETLGGIGGQQVLDLYNSIIDGTEDYGLNRQGGNEALEAVVTGLGKMDTDLSRSMLISIIENSDPNSLEILLSGIRSMGVIGTSNDIEFLRGLAETQFILTATVNEAISSIEKRTE